jgi:hypothetical protein
VFSSLSAGAARGTYLNSSGITQPALAPRFSRTSAEAGPLARAGEHTSEVLSSLGFSDTERLLRDGVVIQRLPRPAAQVHGITPIDRLSTSFYRKRYQGSQACRPLQMHVTRSPNRVPSARIRCCL